MTPDARGLVSFASLLLLLTAPGPMPAAQEPPAQVPVFGTEVQLITVDAVVLDDGGKPVGGLTRDDFVVSEDERPVEIVRFEAFVQPEGEAVEPAVASQAVATNDAARRTSGRAFAVLLDDLNITSERSEDARRAARAFLERGVRPGDEVIYATSSGDAWWSARIPEGREDLLAVVGRTRGKYEERFAVNQMTEYEAYQIANFEDSPALAQSSPGAIGGNSGGRATAGAEALPAGVGGVRERVRRRWEGQMLCMGAACEPMLRGRAQQLDGARRTRTRATLAAVSRGLEALRPIHGRKSLLLLSEGLIDDPHDRRERDVVALSREANTAIYFLDVRGLASVHASGVGSAAEVSPGPGMVLETLLPGRGAMAFEESVLSSTGSEALASDSGGFSVRNTNDLAAGAFRIAEESRVFYLLGFNAPEGKSATAWRKLQVTTTRRGLTVRARKGYTLGSPTAVAAAPRKDGSRGPAPAVVRAVDSPHDLTGLPMRARVYVLEPGKEQTRVLVAAEFDTSGMGDAAGPHRRLELSAVVRLRDEPQEFRYDQALELTREDEETAWRAVVREFGVPPGVGVARVVLRDPTSGAIGSVSQRFEVPPPELLRLSTPILSGRVEPAQGPGERPQPAITVVRRFPKDGGLYCQFEVIGARKGPDALPQVAAGLKVWSRDGSLVREAPASKVAPDAEGRVVRLVGIDLAGLPEGAYDLVLDVRDELADAGLRQRESFAIVSRPAAP